MSFNFMSSQFGTCHARLWATGRYGFSLPKKVEITVPDGSVHTYLYYNRRAGLKTELSNRTLVRIAIAQFLAGCSDGACVPVEIDETMVPFSGPLTQVRAPTQPVSLRVRPGAPFARGSGGAGQSRGGAVLPGSS